MYYHRNNKLKCQMDPLAGSIQDVSTNPRPPQKCCCVSSACICRTGCNSVVSGDYVFDANDHTTLMPDYRPKNIKNRCPCSRSSAGSKSKRQASQSWITLIHILCSGALAFVGMSLTSNNVVFNKKSVEMDDVSWRLSSTPLTTELPNLKDKCEPLYILIYAHCLLWSLFLVLDHVARYMHHKTLRSRGHLRAFQRLSRLAAIPFQLVSFWTVLLAIFITIYAQQDEADLEPYCDANSLMSPKNGIAVLLVVEFICVTISSLFYANSIRKFSLEKPPPDVYGWEESNYFNRWIPQALQQNDSSSVSQYQNSRDLSHYEHETKCLLDLLEYYTHANQELSTKLGNASQRLRQLELEKSQQPSQS